LPDFAVTKEPYGISNRNKQSLKMKVGNFIRLFVVMQVRGSVDSLNTMPQAEKSRVRISMSQDFSKLPNSSSHTMALGLLSL
jgi:hypothetical protein